MANYSELMAQAQALMAQAEQARKSELASVIADLKAKMKQYGITAACEVQVQGACQVQGPERRVVGRRPRPQA
jgi:DNA-binding protein H-NS